MDYALIALAALVASGLTFLSGFGLNTILMPVFAIFLPLDVAIAATAVVHLANNLFKFALVGRRADWPVFVRFGVPGVAFAALGAWLMGRLAHGDDLAAYTVLGRDCHVTRLGLVVGGLMIVFAALELTPAFSRWSVSKAWLPVGGAISGFFGGLTGHQGALRAAFLVRCGLSKEAFIGTSVATSCVVDLCRLAVYGVAYYVRQIRGEHAGNGWGLVGVGCLAAFAGSVGGKRIAGLITIRAVRLIVGIMLMVLGIAMGAGAL